MNLAISLALHYRLFFLFLVSRLERRTQITLLGLQDAPWMASLPIGIRFRLWFELFLNGISARRATFSNAVARCFQGFGVRPIRINPPLACFSPAAHHSFRRGRVRSTEQAIRRRRHAVLCRHCRFAEHSGQPEALRQHGVSATTALVRGVNGSDQFPSEAGQGWRA